MKPTYPKEGTQARKALDALLGADGEWVNGQYFLRTLYLSQYHARIWDLENRFHWKVEASEPDQYGFKSYRITDRPKKQQVEFVEVDGRMVAKIIG